MKIRIHRIQRLGKHIDPLAVRTTFKRVQFAGVDDELIPFLGGEFYFRTGMNVLEFDIDFTFNNKKHLTRFLVIMSAANGTGVGFDEVDLAPGIARDPDEAAAAVAVLRIAGEVLHGVIQSIQRQASGEIPFQGNQN